MTDVGDGGDRDEGASAVGGERVARFFARGLRRPTTRDALVLAAAVVLTRAAYYAAGVRFDASPLDHGIHYVDPGLLREDLLSSVWHLHFQPPLYNLYLGAVLKLGGDEHEAVFHVTYLLASVGLAIVLQRLLMFLGVRRVVSAVLALAFVGSPAIALYENWLYVEYPVAVALTVAALMLVRLASGGGARWAVGAFGLLGAVVLSRTSFHLVWLVAVVAMVLLLQPARRREIALAALVPVLACTGWYAKNLIEWGVPASSTCPGINLWRVSTAQLDHAEVERLIAEGELSPYAAKNPHFLWAAPASIPEVRPTGVPLLDRPIKATGTANNWNAKAFREPCRAYRDDALKVARTHPRAFASGVVNASLIFFRPTSDYSFLEPNNRGGTRDFERAVSAGALGQVVRKNVADTGPASTNLVSVGWLVVLAYALAIVAAASLLRHHRRTGTLDSAEALLAAFFLLNLIWVGVIGNLVDAGENNRFRLALDPLAFAFMAAFVARKFRPPRRGDADG